MKKIAILFMLIPLISVAGLTACADNSTNSFSTSNTSVESAIANGDENGVKIHDDIAAENIRYVNISGNARSIVIRQGANESFQFHNADLVAGHTYEVHCDAHGDTLDISIMMEHADADNNILGSIIIDIPQKEFEKIETTGDFRQVFCYTVNSDMFISASNSYVNLDLESEHLDHNITLDGLESNAFRGVSIYLDELPDNVKMELNLMQGGRINDSDSILEDNRLETGSGKPVISINNTKEINVYCDA